LDYYYYYYYYYFFFFSSSSSFFFFLLLVLAQLVLSARSHGTGFSQPAPPAHRPR
jgi:hypothetical protein